MRLIDADKIYEKVQEIEELARKRVQDTKSYMPYPNNLNPSYTRYLAQMDERTMFKHMIADAPTVDPMQWIPCSERLPEPHKEVLTTLLLEDGSRYVMENEYTTYSGGGWAMEIPDENGNSDCKTIAWMPLPEPYQMEVEHE